MKLSEAISKWKEKGIEKEKALEKAKKAIQKVKQRWTKKKQEIFDSIYIDEIEDEYSKLTKATAIKFFLKLWHIYNGEFFDNKLTHPVFVLTKDAGVNFRRRAYYHPTRNEFGFSPRMLNAPFKSFRSIFLHEMCHQAVHIIDERKGYYKPSGRRDIHGATWKKWMLHCKLDPNRLDKSDYKDYLTDEELKEHETKQKVREENLKGFKQIAPEKYKPAQVLDSKNNWLKGVAVCPLDSKGKRWMFVTKCSGLDFLSVPAIWFYDLPKTEETREYFSIMYHSYAKHMEQLYLTNNKRTRNVKGGPK